MSTTQNRVQLSIGNWKMHKSPAESAAGLGELAAALQAAGVSLSGVGLCPTALALDRTLQEKSSKKDLKDLLIFAQNAHYETHGAFTGEWSARMLKDLGATGALVAHSERRQFFGETNVSAGKRIAGILKEGLTAVYCIGETLAERQGGQLKQVLVQQLKEAFLAADLKAAQCFHVNNHFPLLVLAYEPVWAIGTGLAAQPADAQEAHSFIRATVATILGDAAAAAMPILYGGSVKPDNVATYAAQADVDGALVGGASLKPSDFVPICKAVVGAAQR